MSDALGTFARGLLQSRGEALPMEVILKLWDERSLAERLTEDRNNGAPSRGIQ